MALNMRPTGLRSGIDKDRPDYTVCCGGWGGPVCADSGRCPSLPDEALRIDWAKGTVSDELNAWKAWAKLEEVPYLRLARLLRCPTGADFL